MRLIFVIVAFSLVNLCYGQSYKKWSLDAGIGLNNSIGPFAEGYSSNYLTFLHANLGGRYMLSNRFGMKLDVGFDRIKNDEWGNIKGPQPNVISEDFQTHYFRLTLQAVFDIGRMARFERLDENFGMLLHFGFGFSSLKDQKRSVWFKDWHTQGSDEMMNYMFGLTPQYRISDHWSLFFDASLVANAWQSKTFDFTENNFKKGLHGRIIEFSLGASYYLGSGKKHMDWVLDIERPVEVVKVVEKNTMRDEVENKPETEEPEGLPDADNDGIPDSEDNCPSVYGKGPEGCPSFDTDKDGVPDSKDECPETPGVIENDGCPELDLYVKKVFNEAMNYVDFEVNSDKMLEESYPILDKVVKVMNEYPEFQKLEIRAHTDDSKESEPNRVLSEARAKAVKDYLLSKGVEEGRLESNGYGEKKPIASNDNPAGRAQNERIDFMVHYK
jgi:OOP family OmpA-OmpF porin